MAAVFLLACAGLTCLAAQTGDRDVSGVVLDRFGEPLPGAVVQLENSASMVVRSYITGKDGRYRFNMLDQNLDYTLEARYHHYQSKTKRLSKFSSALHSNAVLNVPVE